jgi:hypothetical protein
MRFMHKIQAKIAFISDAGKQALELKILFFWDVIRTLYFPEMLESTNPLK